MFQKLQRLLGLAVLLVAVAPAAASGATNVVITAPAEGGRYVQGSPLAADYACTDDLGDPVTPCTGAAAPRASASARRGPVG